MESYFSLWTLTERQMTRWVCGKWEYLCCSGKQHLNRSTVLVVTSVHL